MKTDQTDKYGWQILSFIYYLKTGGVKLAIQKTYRHMRYLLPLLPRKSDWANFFIFYRLGVLTACDIECILPKSTNIGHPTGIVIGKGVSIGENVKIRQNVTIGKDPGGEFPAIEDNVVIGAGAVIINDVTIGENSIIGANSTVLSDVPPNSVAVGSPAEIIDRSQHSD